ncbi:MAG: glycosyl hydrolase family 18 protein [Chloroflexota bacterium]|nr:glycosyl hydrolase family 18 protein [Chloroflexota bacterium]
MANEQPGPFDRILKSTEPAEPERRDLAPVYIIGTIIGLALLLLILVLPPISILSGGGGSSIPSGPGVAGTYKSTVRSGMPKLPAGLVAASALFDLAAPADQHGPSRITVPLKEKQSEQRNLGIYSYVDGKWQRLSDVTLVASGAGARGDVSTLPGNVAVLKRSKATLQVAGSIPAGTTLDKKAEAAITTLHPIVFIPTDAGPIVGQPPAVPPAGYRVVPAIVAPSADVVDNILRSSPVATAHAASIADAVKQGNFAGIDVDYRSVNPQLKDRYTAFVTELAKDLHNDGRTLTLTLPMPSNDGGTLQTGAYDWEQLGKQADVIELAGELDQELYFQNTEAALKYLTQKVDPTKLLLSISSLSVERGGDGLRTMALNDAFARASIVSVKSTGEIAPGAQVQLVAQNLAQSEAASGMHWDDQSRSVTFSYPGRGGKRTVWVANQFSGAFRLELAQRYGLGGVAINDVSTEGGGGDVWAPVQQLSDTGNLTLARPNGQLLTPTWSVTDGTISPQSGDTATWSAPAKAGTYDVVLIVSDGVVRAGQQVTLDVVAGQ